MKRLITAFGFLLTTSFVFAQHTVQDSLDTYFNTLENDSLKYAAYKKAVKHYKNQNPDVHLYLINKALKGTTNKKLIADFTAEKGVYFRKNGLIDSSVVYYQNAIQQYKAINDSIGEFKTIGILGNAYKAQGTFDKAIKNFKASISFFEPLGEAYQRPVLVNKNNLGGLYVALEDWGNADTYITEVYKHPYTKSNKRFLSSTLINLSSIKTKRNQLDKALEYALQAETIEKRPRSLANLYNNIGILYEKQENYKLANTYYLKSLKLNEDLKNTNGIQRNYNNLGNNAIKWKKYDEAETYLLQSNQLLESTNNINSLRYNYEMLTALYNETANYKKALEYSLKEKQINDSILGVEKQKAIADFEVKYETEKKEKEKNLAKQQLEISKLESSQNRNLFIGSVIIALLILVLALFYSSRLKVKRKAELVTLELKETQKRLALEKQYKDSELKALKAQMNPHFIFNALNSIQDYIVLNQKNLASDYLGKFADLIRNYLHFSDTGFISIADEIYNLKLYLELEKLRFEDQLDYTFSVDDNADSEILKIPTMLIQPYVENALKHGLLHKKAHRKLLISITKKSDSIIECIIEDNGIGREKSKEINQKRNTTHQSFALKATTQRLDLLNFGKLKKIGVEIIDLKENNEASGTRVILKIPIIKK